MNFLKSSHSVLDFRFCLKIRLCLRHYLSGGKSFPLPRGASDAVCAAIFADGIRLPASLSDICFVNYIIQKNRRLKLAIWIKRNSLNCQISWLASQKSQLWRLKMSKTASNTCRFAFQYGAFCIAKRRPLQPKTASVATENGLRRCTLSVCTDVNSWEYRTYGCT